jgi:hypothetical protein
LGSPVVPEVKPIRQTSSLDVSQAVKWGEAVGMSCSKSSSPVPPTLTILSRTGAMAWAFSSSSLSRASQIARPIRAFSMGKASSRARSSGIVATAMPPAFITAR